MKLITDAGPVSGIVRLNRNEVTMRRIKARLDDAYRDLLVRVPSFYSSRTVFIVLSQVAATMRLEVELFNTHAAVENLSVDTVSLGYLFI
jgi:hypothetical protein